MFITVVHTYFYIVVYIRRGCHTLKKTLYKLYLKAAQEWGNSWYIILDSVIDSTNLEIERKCRTIDNKLNKLCKVQNQNNDPHKLFYPRVDNRTEIKFSGNELALLNKGHKYNLNFKPKNWIKNLTIVVYDVNMCILIC